MIDFKCSKCGRNIDFDYPELAGNEVEMNGSCCNTVYVLKFEYKERTEEEI